MTEFLTTRLRLRTIIRHYIKIAINFINIGSFLQNKKRKKERKKKDLLGFPGGPHSCKP